MQKKPLDATLQPCTKNTLMQYGIDGVKMIAVPLGYVAFDLMNAQCYKRSFSIDESLKKSLPCTLINAGVTVFKNYLWGKNYPRNSFFRVILEHPCALMIIGNIGYILKTEKSLTPHNKKILASIALAVSAYIGKSWLSKYREAQQTKPKQPLFILDPIPDGGPNQLPPYNLVDSINVQGGIDEDGEDDTMSWAYVGDASPIKLMGLAQEDYDNFQNE